MSEPNLPTAGIAPQAWSLAGAGAETQTLSGGRAVAIVRNDSYRVRCEGLREQPPVSHRWMSKNGDEWRRHELAASVTQSQSGSVSDKQIVVAEAQSGNPLRFEALIASQVPRTPRELRAIRLGEGILESNCPWTLASLAIENLIGCHLDLMSSATESPANNVDSIAAGEVVFTSTELIANEWQKSGDPQTPRMALIVRLASELAPILTSICRNPRKVLRRVRQMQRLNRVREVDGGGLRWLARQPGSTIAERAGSKQECLAVVREEHLDTMENRVARDCMLRCLRACQKYLRENRQARTHARVGIVSKFRNQLTQMWRMTALAEVTPLTSVPEPNYVLQMDQRYSIVWHAYLQLVRQQQLEDDVWRWRQRLFSEHVQIAVIAVLQSLCCRDQSHGGDVIVRREQNAGTFFDPRTALGPWCLPNDEHSRIDFVRGDQLREHKLLPDDLGAFGPDLAVVIRHRKELQQSAYIWTTLDFGLATTGDPSSGQSWDAAVSHLGKSNSRLLLIEPQLVTAEIAADEPVGSIPARQPQLTAIQHGAYGRSLRVPLPMQSSFREIAEQVAWALDLEPSVPCE